MIASILAVVMLPAFASCTVLEDRTPCPGQLIVDIREIHREMEEGTMRLDVLSADGATVASRLVNTDGTDTLLFVLPKTEYTICAAAGQDNTDFSPDGQTLRSSGSGMDAVYALVDKVSVEGEFTDFECDFRKQFANVTVAFNISYRHERFPDSLSVISQWNGIDIHTMRPVRGDYGHTFVCTGIEQTFRVLRQGDDSLILRLTSRTKGVVDDVPLGRLLALAGYSWEDENLKDIRIEIDEASAKIRISILDWMDGEPLVIEF